MLIRCTSQKKSHKFKDKFQVDSMGNAGNNSATTQGREKKKKERSFNQF